MCKLFAISDTSKMTNLLVDSVLQAVRNRFSASQKDGFGFAMNTDQGLLLEKYVRPSDFLGCGGMFRSLNQLRWMKDHVVHNAAGAMGPNFATAKLSGPLIAHGRTSTNAVSLSNTHPFHKEGWTLAHNGCVEPAGALKFDTKSSCDSEHLLNLYVHAAGAQSYSTFITGWFATMAISPKGHLHIVKDDTTGLFASWFAKWEAYVFMTDADMLSTLGHSFAAEPSTPYPVVPYVELVLNGNECVRVDPIEECRILASGTANATRAIGRAVTVSNTPSYSTQGETLEELEAEILMATELIEEQQEVLRECRRRMKAEKRRLKHESRTDQLDVDEELEAELNEAMPLDDESDADVVDEHEMTRRETMESRTL